MYKPSQFAKLINVSVQTLRNWEKQKKLIPITLPSGQKRYTESQLTNLITINNTHKLND